MTIQVWMGEIQFWVQFGFFEGLRSETMEIGDIGTCFKDAKTEKAENFDKNSS